MKFTIRVPATTANLGVGFDTLGLAFQLYLEVHGETTPSAAPHFEMHYEGEGNVTTDPQSNLLLQAALHTHYRIHHGGHGPIHLPFYNHHHIQQLPPLLPSAHHSLRLRVVNPIPLSRGLGSSACAIVAGVLLGNLLNGSPWPMSDDDRIMDTILELEGHPDNVTASYYGGLTCSYLRTDEERRDRTLPHCVCIRHRLHPDMKCVAVIPDFELSTAKARQVLPTSVSRADTIYTMQRLSVLLSCITSNQGGPLDPRVVFEAFRDRLHQPYRMSLIPGLESILMTLSPDNLPGLFGICLSGAGPTVLAFCSAGKEGDVAERIQGVFKEAAVSSRVLYLDVDDMGIVVTMEDNA